MEPRVVTGDIAQLPVDAILVNLFEGVDKPGGATAAVDAALGGAISRLIADGEIKGKLYQIALLHTLSKIPPQRVAVVGLGKAQDFTPDRLRGAVGEACRALRRARAGTVASILHGAGAGGMEPGQAARAITEGAWLGLYTFRQHLSKIENGAEIKEFQIVLQDDALRPAVEEGMRVGRIVAEATALARDMANEPANFMTPTQMAEEARRVAQAHGLGLQVLERQQMQELGMGGLLGVSQGSHQPPKFIILTYQGGPLGEKPLGLIGKGITFDSGGISLKPAEGMGSMKADMSGGAAVIAAMQAIAQLKPGINVTGLVPATENLPGGGAYRPGDVLRIYSGKTVEVISTDAEGRLILADALSYGQKLGFSPMVDLATLTGACHVALGDGYSGAFGNNQAFLDQVIAAGREAGERHWPLPLEEDYKEQIKSEVADIKNSGGRYGGAITAALFLSEFVGDTPWVHLDIAGTADTEKERGYLVKGATGVGVRTLVNLALRLAEKK